MQCVKMDNVSLAFNGRAVVKSANFAVSSGDFVGVVGQNGIGKSTVLRLIVGFLQPDEGSVEVLGKKPRQAAAEGRIAYVSQKAAAFNASFPATAEEIVALGLYKRHTRKSKDSELIRQALEAVGLRDRARSLAGKLSGGQQQRVFIARALVSEPSLILLDEPTAGVDVDATAGICCLLGELNKNLGITIVMVTHDISTIVGHANKLLKFDESGTLRLTDNDHAAHEGLFRHTCHDCINFERQNHVD